MLPAVLFDVCPKPADPNAAAGSVTPDAIGGARCVPEIDAAPTGRPTWQAAARPSLLRTGDSETSAWDQECGMCCYSISRVRCV